VDQTLTAASKTARLYILGRDSFGNTLTDLPFASVHLDLPLASGTGAIAPTLVLSDVGPGVAAVDFTSSETGSTWTVSVTAAGIHLLGSPFPLTVVAAITPDLTKTKVWGSAVDGVLSQAQQGLSEQSVSPAIPHGTLPT
jgi:hypothetical protein